MSLNDLSDDGEAIEPSVCPLRPAVVFAAPLPRQFFMSLRDIAFWIHSARADAALERMQKAEGLVGAFDHLYGDSNDPWRCTAPQYRYQRLKYDKLRSYLPVQDYPTALDVGCGVGVFTRILAECSGDVLGLDISPNAVLRARTLSEGIDNVRYDQADVLSLGAKMAGQQFSLIALADVLYYVSPLSDEVLKGIVAQVEQLLAPGATLLVANHYFFDLDPSSRMVSRIHAAFRWAGSLTQIREERQPFFLATVYQKNG